MDKHDTRKRINSIGDWLKDEFGSKVVKLSLDGGFTCPNRDGSKGFGGCVFCSPEGSGEIAADISGSDIPMAIYKQTELLSEKWPKVNKYIVYFQSHTSTYAPVDELREKYYAALDADIRNGEIMGIAIATRPDCLDDDILDLLSEINERTFMWVELGLQTIHGDKINRCYDLPVYDDAVRKLISRNIKVVTHLILGLPGESKEQMKDSVRHVCSKDIFGLKLHLLNVIKGSGLALTHAGYSPFDSIEEYTGLVCDLLEIIPQDITIHRLTGDVPRKLLISPPWSYKKRTILNGIAREMKRRNSFQGMRVDNSDKQKIPKCRQAFNSRPSLSPGGRLLCIICLPFSDGPAYYTSSGSQS